MRAPRLLPLTALALAAAAALTGCGSSGGSSTADAKTAYATVKAKIVALGTDVGSAVDQAPKETDAALATQFDGLAARARTEVTALDGLDVPSSVTAARAALRDALSKGAGDLSDIATASKASDASAARIAAEKLVADSAAIKAARAAFEQTLTAAK